MKQDVPISLQHKLKTNFVLRIVLVVAFACVWALPLVLRVMAGSRLDLGRLYAMTFTEFFTASMALAGGFLALEFKRRSIVSGETDVQIDRKLKVNMVLRVVLAAAFVCLWASPLLLRSIYGSALNTGSLYAATWTELLTTSLALVGGFLALQFTKNKMVKDSGAKIATPVLES